MEKKLQTETIQQRKRMGKRYLIGLIVIFVAAFGVLLSLKKQVPTDNSEAKSAIPFTKQGTLTFHDVKHKQISTIDIEIADNQITRENGLMYRKDMKQNQGMLFIFDELQPRYFWMKNTILPLDIIFLNLKGEVVNIKKHAEPFSEKTIFSELPAKYVVEVNAGYCDSLGISKGSSITWNRTDK